MIGKAGTAAHSARKSGRSTGPVQPAVVIEIERIATGTGLGWRARRLSPCDLEATAPDLARLTDARTAVKIAIEADEEARRAEAALPPRARRAWGHSRRDADAVMAMRMADGDAQDAVDQPAPPPPTPAEQLDAARRTLAALEEKILPRLRAVGDPLVSARNPFFASARKLLENDVPPEAQMTMRHIGHATIAMTGLVGEAARFSVQDGDRGMRLVPFRPFTGMRARSKGDHGDIDIDDPGDDHADDLAVEDVGDGAAAL